MKISQNKIRMILLSRNMSIKDLANLIGVTSSNVYQSIKSEAYTKVARDLMRALDVPIEAILSEEKTNEV